MDPKKLVFYNKEGYRINTTFDEYHETDIYFDKNSTDTFKTQGLYVFEETEGQTEELENSELIPYKIYNTNGIYCYPSTQDEIVINNVKRTIHDVSYYTKWLYVNDTSSVQLGMYITIKNFDEIDGSAVNYFDEVYQVITVENDRIMILTTNDNTGSIIYTTNKATIKLLNVIEVEDDASSYPSISINDVNPTSSNSNHYTKWLEISPSIIHQVRPGMFINLSSFTSVSHDGIYEVIAVKNNKIMIKTDYNNTVSFTYTTGTASLQILSNYIPNNTNPTVPFTTSPAMTEQRFSFINGGINDGIYTNKHEPHKKTKKYYTIDDSIFTPSPVTGNKIKIDINLKSGNLVLANGVDFVHVTSPNEDYLIVDYIPQILKVGDIISAIKNTYSLTPPNDNNLTVTGIDRVNNYIYVGVGTLTTQSLTDATLVMASNTYTIEQEIVTDNANNLSYPVTFNAIIAQYQNILNDTNERINLIYDDINQALIITSEIIGDVFDVNVYNIDGSPITSLTSTTKTFYPITVVEQLKAMDYLPADCNKFRREIEVQNINDFISFNINGTDYLEPYDTSITNTLANWVTTHNDSMKSQFIIVTQIGNNIIFEGEFYDVDVFLDVSRNTKFRIKHKDIIINNIHNELIITIDGKEYSEPVDTSDATTVSNWVANNYNKLEQLGIQVTNVSPAMITFYTELIDYNLVIDINIGYIPKEGDNSIMITEYYSNKEFSGLFGNKIKNSTNFINKFSVGQTIIISGTTESGPSTIKYPLMDISYTIIEIEPNYITLSYQGPFKPGDGNLIIKSDTFIKKPQFGYSEDGRKAKLKWSWKDTLTEDFFLYDITGEQLKPYDVGFPDYNGIKPLCGSTGDIQLKLIREPNKDLKEISNPQKQQTVFDILENTLSWNDEVNVDEILPNPIQIFIGYKSKYEMWNKARLYLEFIEDIEDIITTIIDSSSTVVPPSGPDDTNIYYDDYIIMKDNYLEIKSISPALINFNFRNKYYAGQKIMLKFKDITGDDIENMTFENAGKIFTIKEVFKYKLVFEEMLHNESTIQIKPKTTYPTKDNNGNQYYLWRIGEMTIKVMPRLMATFDIYGESEEEEKRFNVALNNRHKNILTEEDFFIFKPVDINEEGIDWIFMNRKRKELLEIYGEIFNYVSSYKSVVHAINFFGYNDLSFEEYFQNVDPESNKYGQIFNLELLNILDKQTKQINYKNLKYTNLRNEGYLKTNLFSLGYRVTDEFGNFVDSYSLKEVKIKLLGLKRWLSEHLIPLGTKIMDINAKYQMQTYNKLTHETYKNKNFKVEEYSTGIYFNKNIFMNIVNQPTNTYDISIEFLAKSVLDPLDIFYDYEIKTYNVEIWNNINYNINSYVLYDNEFYTNPTESASLNDEPSISPVWEKIHINKIPIIQHIRDTKYQLDIVSLTINELLDPMIDIVVNWHNGYGTTYSYRRTYHIAIYNEPIPVIY